MALAPPYDQIPKLVPVAVIVVQSQLDTLINFLTKEVNELLQEIQLFSKNIKCDDPRVKRAKSLLGKIKQTVNRILELVNTFSTIIPIARAVVAIASIVLTVQLIIPAPAPPAASQTITIQNETIASIAGALILIGVIIDKILAQLNSISSKLGPAINSLSSICQNETFVVDSKTQESIINDVKDELSKIDTTQYQDSANSEFYRSINVSDDDLDKRQEIVDELVTRQKNLLENIIEAPSKSIVNDDPTSSGRPSVDVGTQGDYYIDKPTRTLYGPKISDTDWGTGLNY